MYGSVMLITLFLRLKSGFYQRLTTAFRVDKRVSVLFLIGFFVTQRSLLCQLSWGLDLELLFYLYHS